MLRPFTELDFDLLSSWVVSPELLFQFSANTFPYPLAYTDVLAYQIENPDRRFFIATDAENGDYGFGEIIPQSDGIPRLGRLLIGRPERRGRGLGKKMITLLIEECKKKFSKKAVQLYVLTDNLAGIRCYEAIGFYFLDAGLEIDFNGITKTMRKMQFDF